MKQLVFLGLIALALVFFAACGSEGTDAEGDLQGEHDTAAMEMDNTMASSPDWIREEPVDVTAVDENKDGFVYQDPMDWNVIADVEGKCPKCGMFLKKVTIDEAIANLKDNGFTVK